MIATLFAAAMASANAQATPPAQPQGDQQTAQQGQKKMACCEKMAKSEGCDCCKGMADKAKGGTALAATRGTPATRR